MMHLREHGRVSLVAWSFLIAAMVICYVAIAAGIVGAVSAWMTSMIVFSAAMVGCIAALIYLIRQPEISTHRGAPTKRSQPHADRTQSQSKSVFSHRRRSAVFFRCGNFAVKPSGKSLSFASVSTSPSLASPL